MRSELVATRTCGYGNRAVVLMEVDTTVRLRAGFAAT
jgi:hypothetical protein